MNKIIYQKHIKGAFLLAFSVCFGYSSKAQVLGGLLNSDFRAISVSERAVFSGEVQLNQGLWLNGDARFSADLRTLGNMEVGENVQIDGALSVAGMVLDTSFEASTLIGSNEAGQLLRMGEEQLQQLLGPIVFPPVSTCINSQIGATNDRIPMWTYDINKIVIDDCAKEKARVGIGTLNPREKLDVTGGIQANTLHLRRNTTLNPTISAEMSGQILVGGHPNGVQNQERLIIMGYDNGSKTNFIESQSDANGSLYLNPNTGGAVQIGTLGTSAQTANLFIGDDSHGVSVKRGVGLSLNTFGGENGLVLHESGGFVGIGIGTDAPQAQLHIKGGTGDLIYVESTEADPNNPNSAERFKVNAQGKVYTNEVNVKLGDFPDYVFSKEYELMPLNQLKQSIAQNKKLPNMPSAKDVSENGANLGELNRLLVEKVEELTLYIIQLEERMHKLENNK